MPIAASPICEEGKAPPTAEALMRSRYTAFVHGDIDYLEDTLAPGTRDDFDRKAITHWAKQSQWLGLEILSTEAGREDDDSGYVEFIASFSAMRANATTIASARCSARWTAAGISRKRPTARTSRS